MLAALAERARQERTEQERVGWEAVAAFGRGGEDLTFELEEGVEVPLVADHNTT